MLDDPRQAEDVVLVQQEGSHQRGVPRQKSVALVRQSLVVERRNRETELVCAWQSRGEKQLNSRQAEVRLARKGGRVGALYRSVLFFCAATGCGIHLVDVLAHTLEERYNVINGCGVNELALVVPQTGPEVVWLVSTGRISGSRGKNNIHMRSGNPIIIAAAPTGPPNSYLDGQPETMTASRL